MTPDELKELGFEEKYKGFIDLDINERIQIEYDKVNDILSIVTIGDFDEGVLSSSLSTITPEKLSAFIKSFKELYE